MGLDIKALKPIKYLGTEEPDTDEDFFHIFTHGFPPIQHLTQFKEGYWECEEYGNGRYSAPYGSFMRLREAICKAIYGKKFEQVCDEIESGAIPPDAPFAEMIYFADNEGSFDYPIAKKLCADFEKNIERIKPELSGLQIDNLTDYIHVLSDVVKCQGVAFYH